MTSPVPADLLPYVPTLERARNERVIGLDPHGSSPEIPDGAPTTERRLAAMVVNARVVRREVKDEITELPQQKLAAISGQMPPLPRDFQQQSWVVRLRAEGGTGQACTNCDLNRPGYNTCHICGGNYWRPDGSCNACDRGYTACALCEGSGRTFAAEIRRVDDEVLFLVDAFVPEVFRYTPELFRIPALMRDLLAGTSPPLGMAFPIAARMQGSAYRDAVRRDPEAIFQGYRLEDAMEKAKGALLSMMKPKTEIVLFDVRSFAWPLLWATFGKGSGRRELILVVRPDGAMGGFSAEAE
jgi:hypothetical protein